MTGYLPAEADLDRSTYLVIPHSTEADQWGTENVEFCTSAAINSSIQRLARYAISASAELLVLNVRTA